MAAGAVLTLGNGTSITDNSDANSGNGRRAERQHRVITEGSGTTASGAFLIVLTGGSLTVSANSSDNSGTLQAIDGGSLTLTHIATTADAASTNETSGLIEASGTESIVTANTLAGDVNYGTEDASAARISRYQHRRQHRPALYPNRRRQFRHHRSQRRRRQHQRRTAPSASSQIGGNAVAGTVEAVNGGTVTIYSGTRRVLDFSTDVGATVSATGANSTVGFDGGTVGNGGLIEAVSGGIISFDNVTVDNGAFIKLDGGAGAPAKMVVGDTVTLDPGTISSVVYPGTVTLAPGLTTIVSNGSAATLTVDDNTIIGAGAIGNGDGTLTLINDATGVIEASGGPLQLTTGTPIENYGTLEADGAKLGIWLERTELRRNSRHGRGADLFRSMPAPSVPEASATPAAGTNGIVLAGSSASLRAIDFGTLMLNGTGTGSGAVSLSGGTIGGYQSTAETLDNVNNTISGDGRHRHRQRRPDAEKQLHGVIDANVGGVGPPVDQRRR